MRVSITLAGYLSFPADGRISDIITCTLYCNDKIRFIKKHSFIHPLVASLRPIQTPGADGFILCH